MSSYGRAGGSLDGAASFAASAETAAAGKKGELLTAALLDEQVARFGITVLHDLRIPGAKANIDHVVVSGRRVWVIDSKMWRPGFYFTLFGKTYRGLERVHHADKRGLPFGHDRLREYLEGQGLNPSMRRPLMVIHPSRPGEHISMWAYRPASTDVKTRAITPAQLRFPAAAADSRIVAALARLMN